MTDLPSPLPRALRTAFREGLGIGGIATAGSYFAALPVLRRVRRDHAATAAERRRRP